LVLTSGSVSERTRRLLLAGLVFLLPLHTVFIPVDVALKPFLALLAILAVWDMVDGLRDRTWPWDPKLSIASGVLLAVMIPGWRGLPDARGLHLWLALVTGVLLILVIERALWSPGAGRLVMRSVLWSAVAVAGTAVVLSFVVTGAFGEGTRAAIDSIPGIFRIGKAAYLDEGFIALTNWHQDPGYAAAWMNLWAGLVVAITFRGWGFSRWWLNAMVVGGLGAGVFMTLSRTGWLGYIVALVVSTIVVVLSDRSSLRKILVFVASSIGVGVILVTLFWATDPAGRDSDLGEAVAYRLGQGASLGEPFVAFDDPDAIIPDSRSAVWTWYLDSFRSQPIAGIGLGAGWGTDGPQEPHNLGLQLLGESGLIGLLGFAAVGFVVIRFGGGSIGAVALIIVASSALTQTVLFEPTLWFSGALYLGHAGVRDGTEHSARNGIRSAART